MSSPDLRNGYLGSLTPIVFASADARLSEARKHASKASPPLLIVAPTRSAADEFAFSLAADSGATFGITRSSVAEIVVRTAIPALSAQGLTPSAPLSDEAVAARVVDDLMTQQALKYFAPVAEMPGFPRALSRTLAELRMAGVASHQLKGHDANDDLAALLTRAADERARSGAVDYATMLATATSELAKQPPSLASTTVVLLDVAITSKAEAAFVKALIGAAGSVVITIPAGDTGTLTQLDLAAAEHTSSSAVTALNRLQTYLFADVAPPSGDHDNSVELFSAPGEGREAIEIARRLMREAQRGVPFDQMAILLRAPQTYLGVLEHALERAGIPVYFERGTRRPHPAGPALLALLACAGAASAAKLSATTSPVRWYASRRPFKCACA